MGMRGWTVAEALHWGSYAVKASSSREAGLETQGGAGWGVGGLVLAVGHAAVLQCSSWSEVLTLLDLHRWQWACGRLDQHAPGCW